MFVHVIYCTCILCMSVSASDLAIMLCTSVVKRSITLVLSQYKKIENVTVPDLLKYRWYRGPSQPGSWCVGPYNFRDVENVDRIAEPNLKTEFTV